MGATGSTDKIVAQCYRNALVQERIVASRSEFSWMTGNHTFQKLAELNCVRWSPWASAADTIKSLEKYQDNASNRNGRRPIIVKQTLIPVPVVALDPDSICCYVPSQVIKRKVLARSIRDAVDVVTVSAVLETDLTGAEEKLRKMIALGRNLNQFLETFARAARAECGMQRMTSAEEAARPPLEHSCVEGRGAGEEAHHSHTLPPEKTTHTPAVASDRQCPRPPIHNLPAHATIHCPIPAQAVIHCPNNPRRHAFPTQAIIRARPKPHEPFTGPN